MKKVFIFFTAMLIIVWNANARGPKVTGDFTIINQESLSVQVCLNYAEALMDDMPFDNALLEMKYTREQWEQNAIPELTAKFCNAANDECKCVLVSQAINPQYSITVRAVEVDDDGETKAIVTLYENTSNAILGEVTLEADGGRYGSWVNLMGDAMERMGKELGKIIDD